MFSNKQTHRKGNQICGPQRLGWREGELDEGGQKITNFLMYVSQIIMLYTLNLYSSVCQLYLNKTGLKKEQMFSPLSRIVSSTCYIFPHSLSFYNTKIHGTPSLLSAPPQILIFTMREFAKLCPASQWVPHPRACQPWPIGPLQPARALGSLRSP